MPDSFLLSRRQFAAAAAAIVPAATAMAEPGIDLGSIALPDILEVWARLHGGLDGAISFAWFGGTMAAVAPGGAVEPLCGYRGIIARRLRRLAGAPGWRLEQREIHAAHARTGTDSFTNPITGARVVPAPPVLRINRSTLDATAAAGLGWSGHGQALSVDQPFRTVHDDQDKGDPDGQIWRESASFTFARDHGARDDRSTAIRSSGTMLRTTAWPDWLGMGGSPGHVLCQARFVAGSSLLDEVPPEVRGALTGSTGTLLRRFA